MAIDASAMMAVSKEARRRAQRWPFRYGNHTPRELALLLLDGKSFADIARLWSMLPRAGPEDLRTDITHVWIERGCPGGMPRPEGHSKAYADQWALWRGQRDAGVLRWLSSLARESPSLVHCPTCTCIERMR